MMVNILCLEAIAMKIIASIALLEAECACLTNVRIYNHYESRNRK